MAVGYVYKRPERANRWLIAYRDVDGRERRETVRVTTKALARRVLVAREEAVERARAQGLDAVAALLAPPATMTLRQFAPEYMSHVRAHCSPKTADRYRCVLDLRILPRFGGQTLRAVAIADVQRFIDGRREAGAAPATAIYESAVLSGMFREAIRRGYADRNPVVSTRKPRLANEIERFLTVEEERHLLDDAPAHLHPLIVAAIYSGLRRGELLGLTWDDVLLSDRKIIVRHTKTRRDRVVPMCDTLHAAMLSLWQSRRGRSVFTTPGTDRPYAFDFKTAWGSLVDRAGMPGLRFHDLRHTFASRLAQRGVPLQAIQALLGHSTIRMTTRYAHLAPGATDEAVKALDRAEIDAIHSHRTTPIAAGASDKAVGS